MCKLKAYPKTSNTQIDKCMRKVIDWFKECELNPIASKGEGLNHLLSLFLLQNYHHSFLVLMFLREYDVAAITKNRNISIENFIDV